MTSATKTLDLPRFNGQNKQESSLSNDIPDDFTHKTRDPMDFTKPRVIFSKELRNIHVRMGHAARLMEVVSSNTVSNKKVRAPKCS